jgi:ABC-type cobalt transport system, ATPase component
MGIIKTIKLIYEYVIHDEEENKSEVMRALDGLEIDIEEGSFVAVLGHNGSGKSTLAKHMNALLLPTGGEIWVCGDNTANEDKLWDIRGKAGMVFQNPDNQIIGNIVEEDVAFAPENIGIETKEIWERVSASLEAVEMSAYRLQSPNKLSGGQKQRVAIAGVLAMKPKCIIMDEPTAMLDPNGRREVIKAIRELNKTENITVILITHYMEETIEADNIYVMDSGKVVMQGTPKEIFSQVDMLKELRLDIPKVTELAHALTIEGIQLPKGILTVEELVKELCRLK